MEFNKTDSNKILFTGLDTAGKTSIILALQREFSQIAHLKPTRAAQRKIFEYLGHQISNWDLGGQERYRIAYLKSPGRYFDNTAVLIYIIDIQNTKRLKETLSYLKDVVKTFKKLDLFPPIYVFLHKMDPVLKKNAPVETAKRILDIKNKATEIIGQNHLLTFMKTSIFDFWTVMTAFSRILLSLYPQSELVDQTIREFGEKNNADAILILDDNSLIIGQYFRIEEARPILEQTTPYFLTLNDSFQDVAENGSFMSKKMVLERSGKSFFFDEIRYRSDLNPLYILIMNDREINFQEESIEAFKKIFTDIIKPT